MNLTLTLCLDQDSILINSEALEALGNPRQVQMLINEEKQSLLLQACTVDDREAVVIPQNTEPQFEMSGHSLLKRIRKITGWTDDVSRVIYGAHIFQHRAIVFDLRLAHPVCDPHDFLS